MVFTLIFNFSWIDPTKLHSLYPYPLYASYLSSFLLLPLLLRMFGRIKTRNRIYLLFGVLSWVALSHCKSGILSGLRANFVFRAKALSVGRCSITSSARSNGLRCVTCAHFVGVTVPGTCDLSLIAFELYNSVSAFVSRIQGFPDVYL